MLQNILAEKCKSCDFCKGFHSSPRLNTKLNQGFVESHDLLYNNCVNICDTLIYSPYLIVIITIKIPIKIEYH